jgi:hypothetical protein
MSASTSSVWVLKDFFAALRRHEFDTRRLPGHLPNGGLG